MQGLFKYLTSTSWHRLWSFYVRLVRYMPQSFMALSNRSDMERSTSWHRLWSFYVRLVRYVPQSFMALSNRSDMERSKSGLRSNTWTSPTMPVNVTRHLCFKNLLDILACNSANKPSFQYLTKSLFAQCSIDVNITAVFTLLEHWAKGLFVGFSRDRFLAESQARMSRGCRFFAIF